MGCLEGTAGVLIFLPSPVIICFVAIVGFFSSFIFLNYWRRRPPPACPWEEGQLQLTGGKADLYFSRQDTLGGSPIFSALGLTLPALLLLWAAHHERA